MQKETRDREHKHTFDPDMLEVSTKILALSNARAKPPLVAEEQPMMVEFFTVKLEPLLNSKVGWDFSSSSSHSRNIDSIVTFLHPVIPSHLIVGLHNMAVPVNLRTHG